MTAKDKAHFEHILDIIYELQGLGWSYATAWAVIAEITTDKQHHDLLEGHSPKLTAQRIHKHGTEQSR
jgi:hypothetical protein